MKIIEEIKKIDNHIIEFLKNNYTDNITIYYNYNNNIQCLILHYDTKNKKFFGCDNAIENIFTKRQEKIFIKYLQDFIKNGGVKKWKQVKKI